MRPAVALCHHLAREEPMDDHLTWYAESFAELSRGVGHVIKGKDHQIRLALTCLVAEGHLLIEDRPGTGKTALARSIAALMGGACNRIQFTPDLLPSDVTGVTVFNQRSQTFEFHHGPVFANIVLADEINRAAPKTQSALLEVMEEGQVTVDATTYAVPRPFTVIATSNPVEFDGTYRLPEAQLDRFLMRLSLGYPSQDEELRVIESGGASATVPQLKAVATTDAITSMQRIADRVEVVPEVMEYVLRIARSSRELPSLRLGVSTRGVMALVRAARAYAASDGRPYVTPDDVKALAVPVWSHRCMLSPDAEFRGVRPEELVQELVDAQAVRQPTPR
jgi:MoxR-like ATPase